MMNKPNTKHSSLISNDRTLSDLRMSANENKAQVKEHFTPGRIRASKMKLYQDEPGLKDKINPNSIHLDPIDIRIDTSQRKASDSPRDALRGS